MPVKRKKTKTKSQITDAVLPHKNNPYGANQWVADPRQQLFLSYYLNPKSPTFSIAIHSALKAGFAKEYAENIMNLMPDWLAERLGKISPMLLKAERNLNELLDLPSETQAMGAFGPIFNKIGKGKNSKKEPVFVHNTGLLKIKSDVSQFVAERIGKSKYGPKVADTSVFNIAIFNDEQRETIARRIIARGSNGNRGSEKQPS